MELDQGLIEDGDSFDSCDPENCTGTMYYDLLPSQIVLFDHPISAFQQGHQAFPFVKLKDNSTCSLNNTYPTFSPWSLFVWTIPLPSILTSICT
jgi:hypothetical protein